MMGLRLRGICALSSILHISRGQGRGPGVLMPGVFYADNNYRSLAAPLSVHSGESSTHGQSLQDSTPTPTPAPMPKGNVDHGGTLAPPPTTNGAPSPAKTTPASQHVHRPHLRSRGSSEKVPSNSAVSKEPAKILTSSPSRRNSWLSNISSKFSSSNTTSPAPNAVSSPTVSRAQLAQPQSAKTHQSASSVSSPSENARKGDTPAPQASPTSKSGHPSFLTSALRRLSSSSGSLPSLGKTAGAGATCPRRVMNIDPNRERCKVQGLDQAKLRRVAFCVDVEIAGTARYVDEDERSPSPPPPGRRPSLTELEHQVDVNKKKEKKLKEKGEGEALKHPQSVVDENEKDGVLKTSGEVVGNGGELKTESKVLKDTKETSKKREKKKRSEEERKERKERKRKQAEADGTVPVEVMLDADSSSPTDSPPEASTPRAQDKPTTDPLRIYRRCCQLRETPILKRVTEQLSTPNACDPATPGIVTCLDFSGYWMQLPDIITFGDYLAVVPVKKLMMEDCGLGDEAVRVILAGLLAAKTPAQARHNRHLAKRRRNENESAGEILGVIEKLSLKNNPQIGQNGWRHISLFINMSRSIKALDLSGIIFPDSPPSTNSSGSLTRTTTTTKTPVDMATVISKALAERLAGARLEELVMAECNLDTELIGKIVDAAMKSGLTRLGLASNHLTREGLEHICRYVQAGRCEGLDLGGNDLRENLTILAQALHDKCPLYALSLADCNLTPTSLGSLFPALCILPNFRFIDLSHNHDLFSTQPDALPLLRTYIPQLQLLKRIHLQDVEMSSEHAIAIAEVLPECPNLAHLNILENPQLSALASAKDEASQEEACALYASLMVAVRVSKSIICIDIEVPSHNSSEVVKALAKQVVAYSLRNMERGPVAEAYAAGVAPNIEPHIGEKQVAVPDILLHLVGHVGGSAEYHDDDEPAPDDDYIVGGTGVVKALGVCLGNRSTDHRRPSRDVSPGGSGTVTPKQVLKGADVTKGKAREMSKDLLGSARKIRARLQPALGRELRTGNDMAYSKFAVHDSIYTTLTAFTERLLFLDSTLQRMIQRFEDEYPETRLAPRLPIIPPTTDTASLDDSLYSSGENTSILSGDNSTTITDPDPSATDAATLTEDDEEVIKVPLSRHNSDVSLASRALALEEGRMHRFGQQVRRDILRPQSLDHAHGTTGDEPEAEHLRVLRDRLETLGGAEIKEKVDRLGPDAVLREIGASAEELALLEREDPEAFGRFREAIVQAQWGVRLAAGDARGV